RNLIGPGVPVTLECGLDDVLDAAQPEWPLDDGGLTEPTLVRAAAHDFDGDAVVRRLDEGDDRLCGQRDRVEVLADGAGHDLFRHVRPRPVYCGDRAVGVVLRLIEHGRVRPGR